MERQETITLDRLKVIILDHGEEVQQVDVEDPREQIIAEFNKQGEQFGLTATVA
jgi:hypothetical protein